MSAGEDPREPESDLQPGSALRKALDNLPSPTPRAEFSARLRGEFLAAPFEARGPVEADAADLGPAPIVTPRWGETVDPDETGTGTFARKRSPWLKLATLAAIAAAILLSYLWPTTERWRVAPSSDFTIARVDGREFSASQGAQLAALLVPGSFLEVEGGSIELILDQRLALSLAPGSAVRLVSVPEPEVLDAIVLSQERGSLAVVTGPEFPGSTLRVRTPDTEARVVGTEFAVDVVAGEGTCVCCGQGSVQVFDQPGSVDPQSEGLESGPVPAGKSAFVFHQGMPPKHGPVIEAHLEPLVVLHQIWARTR